MSMESLYEYGTRAGLWRVLDLFEERGLPLTVFGVARALQLDPDATAAIVAAGHEIASHGLRWVSYQDVDIDTAGTAMCTDMDGGQHEIAALMCRPFTPADIKESP
jgi:peptidoglycan/xylan/chitin deacetylase (PgdA/CDA1 family)